MKKDNNQVGFWLMADRSWLVDKGCPCPIRAQITGRNRLEEHNATILLDLDAANNELRGTDNA